jgi:8-oxo-dGTP diphosphatase
MKREFPESPLVGVGAIIIDPVVVDPNKVDPDRTSGSRVVLVKRGHPPIQGQWSIPGGVLEVGEFVRDAALREAREETGLIVEPGELLGVFDRVLRHADGRVQYHYVLVDFLCRPVGGELCAASDAVEVRWFTREELPALNLAEDTLEVIEKAFEKIVSRG